MESNDSPEIPDRGETSDIPGLPSGDKSQYTSLSDSVPHGDPLNSSVGTTIKTRIMTTAATPVDQAINYCHPN